MSKLEELINELCPNGVEYKALNEFGTMIRGSGLQKSDFTDNGVGCVHYGQIYTYYGLYTYNTKSFVSAELAGKLKKVNTGDLIIAVTSENLEDVCKCMAWLGEDEIVTGGHSAIFKHKQNPKYLAYYFQTSEFFNKKKKIAQGTKVIEISPKKLESIKIPLPPLEIQQEIVRILDNLTDSTEKIKTKLQEEITARKKQYEYYRNRLLNLSEKEPFIELGDIAEFKYGYTDKAKDKGEARFIRITDIGNDCKLKETDCKYVNLNEESQQYLLEKDDLLMARTGATYGKTMLYDDCENSAIYASFLIRIRFPQKEVDPRYYWHFSQSDLYWYQADRLVNKAGQPQFNANVLKLVKLQVPSLNEQEKIVCILDRYNSIYNEIIKKISDEIEATQKQYEYYRDKLLSFKELKKEGV